MSLFIAIVAGIIVATLLAAFIPYCVSVWKLPTGHRPLTAKFDRLGRRIGVDENPDFTEEQPAAAEAGPALQDNNEEDGKEDQAGA